MADSITYKVAYQTLDCVYMLLQGESFFFKGQVYTTCSPQGDDETLTMRQVYRHEGSVVTYIHAMTQVRRVDVEITVSEWSGYSEDQQFKEKTIADEHGVPILNAQGETITHRFPLETVDDIPAPTGIDYQLFATCESNTEDDFIKGMNEHAAKEAAKSA